MANKIFRQVLCSDRIPLNEGYYYTDKGKILFDDEDLFIDSFKCIINPTWWLEEVELPSEPKMALMAFECEDKYKEKEENANPYIVFLEGFTKAIELIKGEGLGDENN